MQVNFVHYINAYILDDLGRKREQMDGKLSLVKDLLPTG